MKITKRRLVRLIVESEMKRVYTKLEDIIFSVLEAAPGIGGKSISDESLTLWAEMYADEKYFPEEDEVFAILDDMLDAGTAEFDVEEDSWFLL